MRNGSDNTYQAERTGKSRRLRILKYWSIQVTEIVACSIGLAAAMMVLQMFTSNANAMLEGVTWVFLSPVYLLIMGAITVMISGITVFQTYFPVLVSMNVTRKGAAGGIVLVQGVSSLVVLLLAAVIWSFAAKLSGEDIGGMMALSAGLFFMVAAVGILFGTVVIRWGKIGIFLMILIFMVVGAVVGVSVAMFGNDRFLYMQKFLLEDAAGNNFLPVLLAGALVYAASGVFAVFATRKAEVRV